MQNPFRLPRLTTAATAPALVAFAVLLAVASPQALAEKADRDKPLNITSNSQGGGGLDLSTHRTELYGDVIMSQGTMVLRAEKVDLRETSDGYHQAYASGETGKQVTFRQARDEPGEFVEGSADQIEYDDRADTVRFIGNANVRRLRGAQVVDQVTSAVLVFDRRSEVFSLEGGNASPNPGGRTRLVIMPRAASGAEAPASAVPLRPSLILQTPRKPS